VGGVRRQSVDACTMRLLPLVDLLGEWNASCLEVPWVLDRGGGGGMVDRLHFRGDRVEVLRRLESEVPFVMHGVPDVDAAVDRWTDAYLDTALSEFSVNGTFAVTVSGSHRFMYRNPKAARDAGWGPVAGTLSQTETLRMSLDEFRERSFGDLARHEPGDVHYYLQLGGREAEWLSREMPSLRTLAFEPGAPPSSRRARLSQLARDEPEEEDAAVLLQVDALDEETFASVGDERTAPRHGDGKRGADARWASPGVVAECHLDFSRNWVTVIRGHRRYLLIPPEHCEGLYVDGDPLSPLYRHSVVDLSGKPDVDKFSLLKGVGAVQVVLGPGDLLFIPSYWLHYIVSLDESIQVNIRSRMATRGRDVTDRCLEHARLRARLGDPRYYRRVEKIPVEWPSALRHGVHLTLVVTPRGIMGLALCAVLWCYLWPWRAWAGSRQRKQRWPLRGTSLLTRTSPAP